MVKDSKSPNYDPSSIKRTDVGGPDFYKDYFSPPAETEGGFVPKEPPLVLEGAVPLPGNVEEAPALFPPSITLPPKLKSGMYPVNYKFTASRFRSNSEYKNSCFRALLFGR